MPDEPEVFMFEFDLDGVVRTQETRLREKAPTESNEKVAEHSTEIAESEMSQWLNKKDDDIASDIEREVRRVLRPFVFGSVTVQAEVSFKPGGSLIIAGTVIAVMSALGTVTSQALSQALGQNLARLVEIPINRVLRRWLNRGNEETADGQLQFEPVSVGINPTGRTGNTYYLGSGTQHTRHQVAIVDFSSHSDTKHDIACYGTCAATNDGGPSASACHFPTPPLLTLLVRPIGVAMPAHNTRQYGHPLAGGPGRSGRPVTVFAHPGPGVLSFLCTSIGFRGQYHT